MKLDKQTVGSRYGKALFELASEKQQTVEIYQELLSLRKIYSQVPELGELLTDKRLDPHDKRAIMDNIVSEAHGMFKNFLEVLFEYHRMNDLDEVIDDFERRYNEEQGKVLGRVITAVPLTAAQKTSLETKVASQFGYEHIVLNEKVDPKILGGVIVEANHKIIDGSLATRFEKIRLTLSNK